MISKLTTAALAALAFATAGSALAQDASLNPRFGEIDLEAGFTPDPVDRQVRAGGRVDASDLGGECVGRISNEPTFRLNYEAGRTPLYIYVYADADTTLVINEPNGQFDCNDDGTGQSDNLNPGIRFRTPTSGAYDIWVGSLSGGPVQARLRITEIPAVPERGPGPDRGHRGGPHRGYDNGNSQRGNAPPPRGPRHNNGY
ncbi:hypothetical protein BH10PSE2_BH10PSE2_27050 [soil metagenome]